MSVPHPAMSARIRPRLTESDVIAIRNRWRCCWDTRPIAREYGVSMRAIQYIIAGERWEWLEDEECTACAGCAGAGVISCPACSVKGGRAS